MTLAVPSSQLLMQYQISLPADYDMQIIRERVRTKGRALDDRAGLIAKVYCVRDNGVDGSPVNEYAPFYVWGEAAAAADFLWRGSGFEGIVRDFGRPVVHTWVPAGRAFGQTPAADVTRARIRSAPLADGGALVEVARDLATRAGSTSAVDGVHLSVAGIDPSTWTSVEFTTSAGDLDPADGAIGYTVLHVSEPISWT